MSADKKKAVWVFGDYRNYFENRVTLQLLAKGAELAKQLGAELCAVVFGHGLDEYVWEYTCHGAEKVYITDDESLKSYSVECFAALAESLIRKHEPEIFLVGATTFGREFAPRVAARLGAGLSADCVALDIDDEGRLVQTAPFYGGNLLAKIVSTGVAPQMATVRPGIFKEISHDNNRKSEKIIEPLPESLPHERVRLVSSVRQEKRAEKLETARAVICGGRGMNSKKKFKNLYELAHVLGAEVGATRPVVYSNWADHNSLIGQAGKNIKPQILISFGVSGAIQHTAGVTGAEFIVAINKNPNASMMKMADVAIVADASQTCAALIRELKDRLEET